MRLGRLILPLFASLAAVGFFALQVSNESPPAQAAGGAALNLPAVNCASAGATVSANLTWSSVVGQSQWVDYSTADGFAPGTFLARGPLASNAESLTIPELNPKATYFWRVNTLTEGGWLTSDTGAFVPCGAPALVGAPLSCDGKFRARVTFRWAPSAANVTVQYLDIGFDPAFPPGGFSSTLAQGPKVQSYTWNGLYANAETFFRVNALDADGVWHTSSTGSFYAQCAPPVQPTLYHSADRLVVSRLGINAPVNVRDVKADANLGDPEGAYDVVRYNFPLFDGLGGYPGTPGTTMIAGHVDYYVVGLAVFAPLRVIEPGEIIDYFRDDGVQVTYQVNWVSDLPNGANFGELARNTAIDALVLITCNGVFDRASQEYTHRRVVYATKVVPTPQPVVSPEASASTP